MSKPPSTRNWWAFFLDYVFFGLGLTFAQTGTVLPAFMATLTTSKALIGSASAVWLGAWLLPQLFAANYLTNKPKKYGYMVWGAVIGRPVFWIFAALLLFKGVMQWPLLVLILFLFTLAWFAAWDAFVAIAWFDLLGKAMDSRARGKLIGAGQVVNGVLAVGAGWIVGQLLSKGGPPYPLNYAAIFTLAGVCFFLSFLAILITVEIPEAVPEQPLAASLRDYLPKFAEVWRNDPNFGRLISVRLLAGLSGLATPFYILHATQEARLGPQIIGSFAAISSIGLTLAGLTLGRVAARQGSYRVIQITSWLSLVPPLLGLALTALGASPAFAWVYVICYLTIGMVDGSMMLGYFNYVLDLAPPGSRPIYVGLTNTVSGLLVVAPILGGWILDYSSYPVLFVLTLIGVTAAAVASMKLPHVTSSAQIF